MIRPAVFNDDLSHTFDKSVEIAKELGIEYLELRNVNGKGIGFIRKEDIANIKSILKTTTVKIASIGSPVFSKGCEIHDDDFYRAQRKILDTMFMLCNELEVYTVRVFGFDKPKAQLRQHHLNDYFDQIVAKWEEPVRAAEKHGVVLMFEPEDETYLGTGEDLSRVVKHFNSPSVKVCWDVSNAWNAGDISYPNGYQFIKNDIAHVHVKDAKLDPKTLKVSSDRVIIGQGDIPWAEIFKTLHADGYDGFATVETPFLPWTAELRPYLMEFIKGDVAGLKSALKKAGVPH